MPSGRPLRYRELLSRLTRFGVQEIVKKGSRRILFKPDVEGRDQSYPIHPHSDNHEFASHIVRTILRRFKIPEDQFWGVSQVKSRAMRDDTAGKRFIDEVNAHPLPVPLFMDLLKIAEDALRGKRRVIPPAAERIMKPGRLYLTDIPENQMGMSIVAECRKRFPDKKQAENTSQSFLFRWFALCIARDEGRLGEFIKPSGTPGAELVHSAVFEVAASCSLNSDEKGGFNDSFEQRVRELIIKEEEKEKE